MKLELKRIVITKLITPANYGIKKGIDRKVVYYLMNEDRVDYTEIDGVKFIVLTEKSNKYKRQKK
ncbi:MAG: hypothetical protein MUO60_08990 [Clostridiaceae bacterium]|nr:hypothetical protein [Clostridiaceae bacterium]